MNVWRVTYGRRAYPKRILADMEDIKMDKYLQEEIKKVFGVNVHEFIMEIAYEKWNLGNLPTHVFQQILGFLNRNDILSLARTSKIYFEVRKQKIPKNYVYCF